MDKSKTWIKKRHRVFTDLVRPFFTVFLKKKYGCTIVPAKDIKAPCLILYNHQTCMDQFMIGLVFKDQIYYMTTEDLFSNGISSKAIKFMVEPIPKSKSVKDLGAVRDCLKVAKEGGNIAITPEGNRTYSGKVGRVDMSIAKLAKVLKIDVVIINIIGGYAVEPRWARKVRKAQMTCRVNEVIPKEIAAQMNQEELLLEIKTKLDVSPFETQQSSISDIRAEKLERVLYICPKCGHYSTLSSHGNMVKCNNCGLEVEYQQDLTFKSDDPAFTFATVYDWYRYQEETICKTDEEYFANLGIGDKNIVFKQSIIGKRKRFISKGNIFIDNLNLTIEGTSKKYVYSIEDIKAIACLGKHKMNFYLSNNEIYQVVGEEDFNPVKYMQIYYHLTNLRGGVTNDEFLGI